MYLDGILDFVNGSVPRPIEDSIRFTGITMEQRTTIRSVLVRMDVTHRIRDGI